MPSNFYKLNKDYINSFQTNVSRNFGATRIKSDTNLLRSILQEVTTLFTRIGGQQSTKRDIPQSGDYPDSAKFNKLVQDIGFDIRKLYNAQALLESDLVNVMNYNSTQRDKTFEAMATVQQTVYSAYIKSKKDLIGGIQIPTTNPFSSATGMDISSKDVFIDADRQSLTLASSSSVQRIADTNNTAIYFAGTLPANTIYPIASTLGVGSHWKTDNPDIHFIDQTSQSNVDSYKMMMIDDPSSNTSVGFSEFEAVRTIGVQTQVVSYIGNYTVGRSSVLSSSVLSLPPKNNYNFVFSIKNFIGSKLNLDSYLIYMDAANSFQGKYIQTTSNSSTVNVTSDPKYKLVIPFTQSVLTNQIVVEFTANNLGILPNVIWSESKVFSNVGGTESAFSLLDPGSPGSQDGRFVCNINGFTYPTRLELMLRYSADSMMWIPMNFYMSHYIYSDAKPTSFKLNTNAGNLSLTVQKIYNIFVDSEANVANEQTRALNVLANPNGVA